MNRWDRRDAKRDKKMKTSGTSVRDLQRILIERARKLKEKERAQDILGGTNNR